MTQLIPITGSRASPLVAASGARLLSLSRILHRKIRNPHARRAYAHAGGRDRRDT